MLRKNHAVLDPSPMGWFAIALSKELKLNEETCGVLCAAPYKLRRLQDGSLEFSGCISAITEQNDFIFAWHHPQQKQPGWNIPELDMRGWRPLRHHQLTARSHPQETYENSIDMAHFPVVHGFTDIRLLHEPEFTDNSMKVRYQITRNNPIPFVKAKLTPNFEVRLHGLGCAHNHINVPGIDLKVRMFALSTPTQAGWVDIRLAVSVATEINIPLKGLMLPLMHWGIYRNVVSDFCQDIAVWENKRYLHPPVLVKDDGPIGVFRQWCRQYYFAGQQM